MCVASDSRTIVVAMLLFVENENEICITVRSLGVSEVTRNYLNYEAYFASFATRRFSTLTTICGHLDGVGSHKNSRYE